MMMKIKSDFIRLRLKELGLTQEDLGKYIGSTKSPRQGANNLLRNGKCNEETANKIAELLKCHISDIRETSEVERLMKAEIEKILKLEVLGKTLEEKITMYEKMLSMQDELITELKESKVEYGAIIQGKDELIREFNNEIKALKEGKAN